MGDENFNIIFMTENMADRYGSAEHLAGILDQGVEMLFYLQADTFHQKEVQNVASALKDVIQVLRQQE